METMFKKLQIQITRLFSLFCQHNWINARRNTARHKHQTDVEKALNLRMRDPGLCPYMLGVGNIYVFDVETTLLFTVEEVEKRREGWEEKPKNLVGFVLEIQLL